MNDRLTQFVIPCQRCGACCRWPGEVRLEDAEIARLAAVRGLTERAFIEQHTRLRQDRRGLALQERKDGSCLFLDAAGCAIQSVKPRQCREFPSGWVRSLWGAVPVDQMRKDYPMLFACPGFREFLKQGRQRDGESR